MVRRLPQLSSTPPHLPNAIYPPDEHALYKDNFAAGNGELSKKVIADIAQGDGNVLFLFHEH